MSYNYQFSKAGTKYGNKKPVVNGVKFDSKREAARYNELLLLEKAHAIRDLRRQVKFELIPTQRDKKGNLLEKSCSYYADFVYEKDGKTAVEDSKGFKTEAYKIKKKLMLLRYGIQIQEV